MWVVWGGLSTEPDFPESGNRKRRDIRTAFGKEIQPEPVATSKSLFLSLLFVQGKPSFPHDMCGARGVSGIPKVSSFV